MERGGRIRVVGNNGRNRIYIIWFVIALWPSGILVPCNGSITIESANKDWCECAPKRTVAYCRGRRHTLHTSAQIDCGVGCIELIGPDYDAIISLVRKFPYKNVHSDSPIRKSLSGFPCYQRSFQHTLSQVSTKSTFLDTNWRAMKRTQISKPKKEKLLKLESQKSRADWQSWSLKTQTRNATDHWQKIYIRVLQSVVSPDTTSMITNPDSDPSESTPLHLYLIEGSLDDSAIRW